MNNDLNIDFKIKPVYGNDSSMSFINQGNWRFELQVGNSVANNITLINYDQAIELKKKIDDCMAKFTKINNEWKNVSWRDETLNDLI